jgi:hypothetical protein
MGESAYIGTLATAVVYLVVGFRLARLAARTGETPERLLSAVFIVTGCSYVVYEIPVIFGLDSLWTALSFTARLLYLPAPILLAAFTRQVFRRSSAWSRWLVYATAAMLATGVAGSVASGDWEGFAISHGWFWFEWLGYTIPFGWAGAEALLQFRRAKLRLTLGLCAPVTCNRFLLWGLFGTIQVIASLLIIPQYIALEQQNLFSTLWDVVVGGAEIVSLAPMWLVFFPPARYRRWLDAGAFRSAAVGR